MPYTYGCGRRSMPSNEHGGLENQEANVGWSTQGKTSALTHETYNP
jgi:hypothetical protein